MEFAQEKLKRHDGISDPFVVGAVIDLGLCLDLTTKDSIENLRDAHRSLQATVGPTGNSLPLNGPEDWRRRLDCAVIKFLHLIRAGSQAETIDTVRGIFTEGKAIYTGSKFLEKTHIQIAVVNLDCIKAVFRVPRSVIKQ